MRKYLISAALVLLAAPCAWADPPSDRGHGHGGEGRAQAEANHAGPPQGDRGNHGRGAPQASIQAPPSRGEQFRGFDRGDRGRTPQALNQPAPSRETRGEQFRGDRSDNGRQMGFDRRGPDDHRAFNDRAGSRPDNRAFNDNRRTDFNRDGRTDFRSDTRRGPGIGGPRHDFSGFRDYHRSFHVSRRFYAPPYRRPAGWYEHRWTYGEYLPPAFWVRDYWLIDFADYDLPPPPFGAVWVRVGPDALLIDEDSGEIITVAYDVFY